LAGGAGRLGDLFIGKVMEKRSRQLLGLCLIVGGMMIMGRKLGLWTIDWQEIWANWWPAGLVGVGLLMVSR
jgi:hypothetical protein